MEDTNAWWQHLVTWLTQSGVTIHKNTELQSCKSDGQRIVSLVMEDSTFTLGPEDHVALCMDPQGLMRLLRTNTNLTTNWGTRTLDHLHHSSYHSIGFRIDLQNTCTLTPGAWHMSVITDWAIILRPRDASTIDCVVCDLSKVSTHTGKSIWVTPPSEFKREVRRQLEEQLLCRVENIEFHDDAWFANGEWHNKHTAVALDAAYGFVPSQGKLTNIHIVSPMNWRSYIITTVEACCEASIRFVNRISKDKQYPVYYHKQYSIPFRAQAFLIPNTLLLLVLLGVVCTVRGGLRHMVLRLDGIQKRSLLRQS